ncbi:MAG: hypothetical protein PF485_09230 [Bacteroidales bacterium]|jgi:hypothetical protein|nr:hypothetical protein [Bacteroidales bacterium]
MKELEVKTYNFAIQGIGLIKSLEKEFPELANNELKQSIGSVSIKFIDALNAEGNEDFAQNIKDCHSSALKSSILLIEMDEIKNDTFNKQKKALINESKVIIEKLDIIISKLIF